METTLGVGGWSSARCRNEMRLNRLLQQGGLDGMEHVVLLARWGIWTTSHWPGYA
jgi:hypothetical protein